MSEHEHDEPLLEWQGDPILDWDVDDQDVLASNDEWAFAKADQLTSRLPQRIGHDRRTEGEVFDKRTLMVLHKLLAGGVLRSIDYPISTGKEANVFKATSPERTPLAVKIYRTNTATFKHVLPYISGDERFQGVKGDKRALVSAWAQKEFRNLSRMRAKGIDVPEPIKQLQNVLVTEYIGTEDHPWPKLKDFVFETPTEVQAFYDKIVEDLVIMVTKCPLVHADLSEYNILVQDADDTTKMRPRIIDVGQAVLTSHPMAREFLERDVRVLAGFFRRKGLKVQPQDILDRIGDWA